MPCGDEQEKRTVLIKEGWFHVPATTRDKPYLIGSRCGRCGFTTFPKVKSCRSCMGEDTMKDFPLSAEGKLDTFAVSMQGPPGFTTPYIQAYVTLPEGIRIFTMIDTDKPEAENLEIGDKMVLVIGKIKVDAKGNDVVGWKFKPVRG
jgi:uncharacterized protein